MLGVVPSPPHRRIHAGCPQNVLEILQETISQRVHRYFPDLPRRMAKPIVNLGKNQVRTHSTVFEFSLGDSGEGKNRGIFVKIPHALGKDETYEVYQHLLRAYGFSTRLPEFLNVVKPLDYLTEIGAIVTERVQGEEMKHVLRRRRRQSYHQNLVRRCGQFLRIYHEMLGQMSWRQDSGRFSRAFREAIGRLETNGVSPKKTRQILVSLDRSDEILKDAMPVCMTLNDYTPGNILIQKNRIFLVELDIPCPGPLYEDLARFLGYLTTLYLGTSWFVLGREVPSTLSRRFLAAYFGPEIPTRVISLFNAKYLCDRWSRSLELPYPRKMKRSTFFIPRAIYHRKVNRFFYKNIMDNLRVAADPF